KRQPLGRCHSPFGPEHSPISPRAVGKEACPPGSCPGTLEDMKQVLAMAAIIGLLAASAVACSGESEGIAISDAYITASSNDVAALYFTVKNRGEADTLESVSTGVAGVASFHQNVVTGASASMQP